MNSPRGPHPQPAPPRDATRHDTPLAAFLAPRFWPLWLGFGFVRVLMLLPFGAQMAVGRGLGRLAHPFARRDRRIADINLRLCFPELDWAQRRAMIRRHFESLGCALLETGLVWWAKDEELRPRMRIQGMEHLARALAGGRGVILLSAHFTTLEMGARAITMSTPTAIMYQTPKNALVAELSRRARRRRALRAIPSDSVRELLQSLRANLVAWYAPDQRDTGKSGTIVPFFGIPAATNVATSRLARISGAPVLPYFPERLPGSAGYMMRIGAPLEEFPSADPVRDAARFHELIEEHVRRCPEQYLWTYKRFKRPGPDGDPYARSAGSERRNDSSGGREPGRAS